MLKSQIFISLLLFVLMSPLAQAATDCAAVTEIPSTECEILIDFYNSTDGVNWIRNGGWNVTNTPCSWYGVSCSGGHVSKLYLDSNKLTGSIPSELGNLSMLREIWLGSNQLTGTIPRKLGNLSNLWMLDLDGNQLTGSIPSELGNLSNLDLLNLSFNQLTGSIPRKLGNSTYLNILDLSSNQLTGSIPSELGNLSNLGWFFLSDNQLTGPIPSELGKLTWLGDLRLDNNELCGEIPVELKNLSNIYKLKLDNNHLTASDSSLIAWLDSRSPGWDTTQTSCSGFFTTPIVRIAENAGTVTLTVQRNGDTSGTLEIDYATTDVSAEQGHDYIEATGTLSWAGGDATDKSFTITIIDDGNSETNETFIVTLSMPISGESLDNATIVIKDNEPADCAVVTEIPSVECEALVALYNSTGGVNWRNNDGWNETNTPCSWNGVSCSEGHVSKLYLAGNQLTGSIPTELGKLTNLRELRLSGNQLTGSIPTELGKLTNLRELMLSRNQLTGSIPTELGNLSNLEFLSLYENDLADSIPSELGNLSNLTRLYLFSNELCGEIPIELKNLSSIPLPDRYGAKLKLDNNHLTASDSELIAWLDSHTPGWDTTQTPCPIATLQFESTTYSVTENGGQATITVTRLGTNNGAISANYATTDGTATAGSDYTQTTGTLSWANGDSANKSFTITIIDDGDSEGPETFTVTLTSPVSGENLDSATVTISDDDATFVTLADFTATANETGILLEWQTATEFDNAGFHLWRATGEGWKYDDYSTVIRLTEHVIAAQGNSSVYSYRDADVESGITYYYGLEDIDLNGQSTFHWDLIDSAMAR